MYVCMYIYMCMYVCMYVRMDVCMYGLWMTLLIIMPIFCFMSIQGNQLLSASLNGDMATVRLLLEEDPNLVSYKDSVRRTEKHSAILSYSLCCIIYSHVSAHPSIIIATSS